MLVYRLRFLMTLGLFFDVWGSMVLGMLQKTTFHICLNSVDFGFIFACFSIALVGLNVDDFWYFDWLDI